MVLGKVDIHKQKNETGLFRKLNGNAPDIGLGNNFRAPETQKIKQKNKQSASQQTQKAFLQPRKQSKRTPNVALPLAVFWFCYYVPYTRNSNNSRVNKPNKSMKGGPRTLIFLKKDIKHQINMKKRSRTLIMREMPIQAT